MAVKSILFFNYYFRKEIINTPPKKESIPNTISILLLMWFIYVYYPSLCLGHIQPHSEVAIWKQKIVLGFIYWFYLFCYCFLFLPVLLFLLLSSTLILSFVVVIKHIIWFHFLSILSISVSLLFFLYLFFEGVVAPEFVVYIYN